MKCVKHSDICYLQYEVDKICNKWDKTYKNPATITQILYTHSVMVAWLWCAAKLKAAINVPTVEAQAVMFKVVR